MLGRWRSLVLVVAGLITGGWWGLFIMTVTSGLRHSAYKVLYNGHAGCLGIGQDYASMSLQFSRYKRWYRNSLWKGGKTTKGFLEDREDLLGDWLRASRLGNWVYDSWGIPVHEVTWLKLRTTSTEKQWREILRRRASIFVWLVIVLHFKFRGWNFFKEGRM